MVFNPFQMQGRVVGSTIVAKFPVDFISKKKEVVFFNNITEGLEFFLCI